MSEAAQFHGKGGNQSPPPAKKNEEQAWYKNAGRLAAWAVRV